MTSTAWRRFAFLGVIGLLSITIEVSPPLTAQAPLLPFATVRTLPQMFGEVWPGDFNEDGITDLASGGDDILDPNYGAFIRVALGNGDGTFRTPLLTDTDGGVRAVADLNRDGFVDVVAGSPSGGLVVLPGNGDGTLQAARQVSEAVASDGFVLTADFNGDGNRDLVAPIYLGAARYIGVFAGRGDFTFGETVLLPFEHLVTQATTGDFDGDGRVDIAAAHVAPGVPLNQPPSGQLLVYMNAGLLQFTRNTIPAPTAVSDLTSRDLNGDGALDLVVSGSTHLGQDYANDGFVYVFTGGGDGMFALAGTYPTEIGPIAVVVADFTRDKRLDVATANRSARILDDGCVWMAGADSVSILAGSGDGAFGAPTSFALGSQQPDAPQAGQQFGLDVNSLNTSDLNRDGHADLIVSDGKVLIAAAPHANRVPVVNAGPDQITQGGNEIYLRGSATDADGHLLAFHVSDPLGRVEHFSNVGCIRFVEPERYELTMTASDGWAQGSDTVVYDFSFTDPGPPGWTNGDIGNVATPGSSVFDRHQSEITVTGSGADIWNRADEFHFVQTPVSGDFSIHATVASVENVHRWTKAGLMIREGLSPGARHASLFVTPTTENGIAFQRRLAAGGLSVHTAGPALTAPVTIMLKRSGALISAYYRVDGPWLLIARDTLPGLAATVNVGLAVSSHVDGTLATARFRHLLLNEGAGSSFVGSDIGAVGVPGTIDFNSSPTIRMEASGADIWGTADAFYFFREWWTADGTATMHVQSLQNTHRWAKFGLMFRESDDPGSRHVMLIVSAAMGVAMQYRAQPGGISSNVAITSGAAPEWLRLRRTGNTFTGYASEDGATWRTIGSVTLPLDLDTFVGVALTSHNNSTLTRGVFDNLSIVRE
ncbi:MAG: FG-GAP-like repeat-containing protein [Vicinamibacterales bacterium]